MIQTDTQLIAQSDIIKNEAVAKANSATRIGGMFENIIHSKAKVSNPIDFTLSIPFTHELTDIATHTMIANIVLTVNATGAVDNACTQLLLINNTSYTADVTAFHVIGEHDNTTVYTLLTFERKRGLYIVSIINFD